MSPSVKSTGNYRTSEGKTGDAAWSTRARWCELFGRIKDDSISIQMIDHPKNLNYPTFWHARGYGLFSANPLADGVFTNNGHRTDLTLRTGESAIFRFEIVVSNGQLPGEALLNKRADAFAETK